MGKKGSWFSAIKRVFTPKSKEKKPPNGSEKKNSKEKKKGGILRHGETKSFIPLFREPSSIEKILGEVDEQKLLVKPPTSSEQPNIASELPVRPASARVTSPRAASPRSSSYRITSPKASTPNIGSPTASSHRVITSPKAASPRAATLKAASPSRSTQPASPSKSAQPASPKVSQNRTEISYAYRREPTLGTLQISATKIQAAYKGYMARRSFRALRGLVRLQGVVRSSNVKRQTVNAMKQMQLLVRVQNQIQSRRIQMLENQALQCQAYRTDKEIESTLSKWTQLSEAGHDNWDDSLLTKEEEEARMRKKVEAVIKRERAMAYAYSHQLWKSNPKSAMDIRVAGFPWWWNWLERQLPPGNASESQLAAKNIQLTPPRAMSGHKPSLRLPINNFRNYHSEFDNHETGTPRSTRSAVPARGKQMHTPSRTPPMNSPGLTKYTRHRASAANSLFHFPLKDDDSLTSCPPFSRPNYMTPTIAAKAKVRPNSNPKERNPGTPSSDSSRRFSFPLTPNVESFKWNKGSIKDAPSQRELGKHDSVGDHVSVDSTVSMPAVVGRKPFNRFV